MNHDPFKGAKRQWKRYDPEPEDDGSFHDWEKAVWMMALPLIVVLLAIVLGNITAPQNQAPPPSHPAKAHRR